VDITDEQFMAFLEDSPQRPSTAVPGLGEFQSYYSKLWSDHQAIVYPTPSHRLTGLYDAAIQAAEQMGGISIVAVDPPDLWAKDTYAVRSGDPHLQQQLDGIESLPPPILVVMNTGFASGATGLVAMASLASLDEKRSVRECIASMISAKQDTNIYFILNTLDYIVDRAGHLSAFLGTLLRIKPILTFRRGTLEDVARARGKERAKTAIVKLLKQTVGDRSVDLFVLHSLAEAEAQRLLEQARAVLHCRNSWVGSIGASVSRYTGRGGLGVAFRLA
jgi:fatty acid-binding protein DegV